MGAELNGLLDRLWQDYASMVPEAQAIHDLIGARGDRVVHDHIALRTFDHPKLGIEATAYILESHGYRAGEEYELPAHNLHTRQYEAPDPDLPRIFISELELGACTRGLRDIIGSLMRQFDSDQVAAEAFVGGGRLWNPVMHEVYERLQEESEHAAWVAAFGFRAHHFALAVNALDSFDSLAAFNAFLRAQGFELDDLDGDIESTPAGRLERSATRAAPCTLHFADGTAEVAGCPYEFTWRHDVTKGGVLPGLLAAEGPGADHFSGA